MTTAEQGSTLGNVDEETAQRLKQRRMALGMSVNKLADLAGIDRGTLKRLEQGSPTVRDATIGAVDATLKKLEEEMGMEGPPMTEDDLVEFRVSGNFGVDVVVKGPLRDVDQLEESVARLISKMQREQPQRRD